MTNQRQPGHANHDTLMMLSPRTQQMAMFIAQIVRDEMEDFHVRHLSDDQMRELNPIIRNAIALALHLVEHSDDPRAQMMIALVAHSIPDYWEEPTLPKGFLEFLAALGKSR
jgi:hypothetical protein